MILARTNRSHPLSSFSDDTSQATKPTHVAALTANIEYKRQQVLLSASTLASGSADVRPNKGRTYGGRRRQQVDANMKRFSNCLASAHRQIEASSASVILVVQ